MRYVFHPEALAEYLEATGYYREFRFELGQAFVKEIETGIDEILAHPRAYQNVEENARRHFVRRFPYGIYYTIEDDYILIVAVMHMSRQPGYWKNRIKG